MRKVLELLSVNLDLIKELSQIFSKLYTIPEKIRYGYIRVKVLEVLLVLTGLNLIEDKSEPIHFSEAQIEVIKQIHTFLIAHFNEHYTIDYLAERFEISPTVMKKCFKGVYGDSIYAYMKLYRLQVAQRLLKESQRN